MTKTTNHRRGDAFARRIYICDARGAPLQLDAANLFAQLYRANGEMISELDIVNDSTPGYYIVSTEADTSQWPLEILKTNIFDYSDKSSSSKFLVKVEEQLSRRIT
jgi:hypothetical protein